MTASNKNVRVPANFEMVAWKWMRYSAFLLIPLACIITLIPLGALIYGIVGAVQTNNGQDFRYWLIGDWVRGELTRS